MTDIISYTFLHKAGTWCGGGHEPLHICQNVHFYVATKWTPPKKMGFFRRVRLRKSMFSVKKTFGVLHLNKIDAGYAIMGLKEEKRGEREGGASYLEIL